MKERILASYTEWIKDKILIPIYENHREDLEMPQEDIRTAASATLLHDL